jgi:hypothetical protein
MAGIYRGSMSCVPPGTALGTLLLRSLVHLLQPFSFGRLRMRACPVEEPGFPNLCEELDENYKRDTDASTLADQCDEEFFSGLHDKEKIHVTDDVSPFLLWFAYWRVRVHVLCAATLHAHTLASSCRSLPTLPCLQIPVVRVITHSTFTVASITLDIVIVFGMSPYVRCRGIHSV